MKRIKVLRIFFISLMVVSVGLFFYPIIGNIIANQARSTAVSNYDDRVAQLSKKQVEDEIKAAEAYNKYLFDLQEGQTTLKEEDHYKTILNNAGVIGTLDVPAIDIKHMPIFHGSDPYTLENGLGHLTGTSLPVGGDNTHSVITGHSGVKNQILFSDVNRMEKGDIFYIEVLRKKLAYEVYSITRVYPNEVDAIRIQAGKDIATLLTCDPPGINTYRLLVTGKRIPLDEAKKKAVVKRNLWNYQHKVIFGTLIFLVILLVWWIIKRRRRRKKIETDR